MIVPPPRSEWSDPTEEGFHEYGHARGFPMSGTRTLPPVLGRLLSGTFWLALRVPLQAVFSLWTIRLVLESDRRRGMRGHTGSPGDLAFFSSSSSLAPARRCRGRSPMRGRVAIGRRSSGRSPAGSTSTWQWRSSRLRRFWAWPTGHCRTGRYRGELLPADGEASLAPGGDGTMLRYLGGRVECASSGTAVRLRAAVRAGDHGLAVHHLVLGVKSGVDFFWVVAAQTAVQVGLGLGPALWVMIRELGHWPHFHGARLGRLQNAGAFQLLHCADPDQRGAGRQGRHDNPRLHAPQTRRGPTSPSTTWSASRSCSFARPAGCWPTW